MFAATDALGIMQETEIWRINQIVYVQIKIVPKEWDALNSLGYWWTNK